MSESIRPGGPHLTRRSLLRVGGVSALALATMRRDAVLRLVGQTPLASVTSPTGIWDLDVFRPGDGLRLRFTFGHLGVVGGMLQRDGTVASQDAYYGFLVPSQHTAEGDVAAGSLQTASTHRAARASRLMFEFPDDPIPFTLEALLDLRARDLRLASLALRDVTDVSQPAPAPPEDDRTSLILPEGLYLSPAEETARFDVPDSIEIGNVTEVFRARLGGGVGATGWIPRRVEVRALWTPGYESGSTPGDGSQFPLSEANQTRIVRATADFSDTSEYPNHEPAYAQRLWLTAHGGYLDVTGSWTGGTGQLAAWEHRIRTGRDLFVKIVTRGYLMPFGHLATVIEVTERTFVVDNDGAVQSQLETTVYLSLQSGRKPVPAAVMQDEGRGFPFVAADLVDGGTFVITKQAIPGAPTDSAFTALVDGRVVTLQYVLTDRVGATIGAAFTAVWISADHAFDRSSGVLADVLDHLSGPATEDERTVQLGGARVGYTDEATPGSGRTTFETDSQRWTFELPLPDATENDLRDLDHPALFPRLEIASVANPALDGLMGTVSVPMDVTLSPEWLAFGNGAGNELLNALTLELPRELSFDGLGSGFANPVFDVSVLNQTLGFAADFAPGDTIDVADLLSGLPKLLGVIDITDLLGSQTIDVPEVDFPDVPTLPGFQLDLEFDDDGIPTKVVATFHWETPLTTYTVSGGATSTDVFVAAPDTVLALDVVACVPFDGGAPELELTVAVNDFDVVAPPFFELIEVRFHEVRLTAKSGEPVEVVPDIEQIRFIGILTLLEALEPLLQFGPGGLDLEPTDEDVTALVRISVPDINLGVLAIRNISIGAGAVVPLVLGRQLATVFEFGTLANPVTVIVLGFGGGFHVETTAAPHPGTFELLRLGVNVTMEQSLNIVVAKGTLSASFGAWLEVSPIEQGGVDTLDVVLGGYVEVTGVVKVLGLVKITIGVSVELTYSFMSKVLRGTATVYAEVDAGLGKKEVTFEIEQEYQLGNGGGSRRGRLADVPHARAATPGGPSPIGPGGSLGGDGDDTRTTLGDRWDQAAWQAYCNSFGS